jgi:hypothetical protein
VIVELLNQAAGRPYPMNGDGAVTVVDIQRAVCWWAPAASWRVTRAHRLVQEDGQSFVGGSRCDRRRVMIRW